MSWRNPSEDFKAAGADNSHPANTPNVNEKIVSEAYATARGANRTVNDKAGSAPATDTATNRAAYFSSITNALVPSDSCQFGISLDAIDKAAADYTNENPQLEQLYKNALLDASHHSAVQPETPCKLFKLTPNAANCGSKSAVATIEYCLHFLFAEGLIHKQQHGTSGVAAEGVKSKNRNFLARTISAMLAANRR